MPRQTKSRKVGRPMLPSGVAKARIVPVRFNPDLFKAVSEAAKARKQNISEWIRGTLAMAIR